MRDPLACEPRDTQTRFRGKPCLNFADAVERLLLSRNSRIYLDIGPATPFPSSTPTPNNESFPLKPSLLVHQGFKSMQSWKTPERYGAPIGCSAAPDEIPSIESLTPSAEQLISIITHGKTLDLEEEAHVGSRSRISSVVKAPLKNRRTHILQSDQLHSNQKPQQNPIPTLARLLGVGPVTQSTPAVGDATPFAAASLSNCDNMLETPKAADNPSATTKTSILKDMRSKSDLVVEAAAKATMVNLKNDLLVNTMKTSEPSQWNQGPSPTSIQAPCSSHDGNAAAVHAGISSTSSRVPASPRLPVYVRWPAKRTRDIETTNTVTVVAQEEQPDIRKSARKCLEMQYAAQKAAANIAEIEYHDSTFKASISAFDRGAVVPRAPHAAAATVASRPIATQSHRWRSSFTAPKSDITDGPTATFFSDGNSQEPSLPPIAVRLLPKPCFQSTSVDSFYDLPPSDDLRARGRIVTFCAGNGGLRRNTGKGAGPEPRRVRRPSKRRAEAVDDPTLEDALLLLSAAEEGAVRAASEAAAAASASVTLPWKRRRGSPCMSSDARKVLLVEPAESTDIVSDGGCLGAQAHLSADSAATAITVGATAANGSSIPGLAPLARCFFEGSSVVDSYFVQRRAVLKLTTGEGASSGSNGCATEDDAAVGIGSGDGCGSAAAFNPAAIRAARDVPFGENLPIVASEPAYLNPEAKEVPAAETCYQRPLPDPILVGVPHVHSGDSGDVACAAEPLLGVFDPARYMRRRECIRVLNHPSRTWVSRSQFEKLCGSSTAKWYRSIRVLGPASGVDIDQLKDSNFDGVQEQDSSTLQTPPAPQEEGFMTSRLPVQLWQPHQIEANGCQKESLGEWLERHGLPIWKGPNRVSIASRAKVTPQYPPQLPQLTRRSSGGSKLAPRMGLGAAAAAAAAALIAADEARRSPAGSPMCASAAVSAMSAAVAAAAAAARAAESCEKLGRQVAPGSPAQLGPYGGNVSALAAAAMRVASAVSVHAGAEVSTKTNSMTAPGMTQQPHVRISDSGRKISGPSSLVYQCPPEHIAAAAVSPAAASMKESKTDTHMDECVGDTTPCQVQNRLLDEGVCSSTVGLREGSRGDATAVVVATAPISPKATMQQEDPAPLFTSNALRNPAPMPVSAGVTTNALGNACNSRVDVGSKRLAQDFEQSKGVVDTSSGCRANVPYNDVDVRYVQDNNQTCARNVYWSRPAVLSPTPTLAAAAPGAGLQPQPPKRFRLAPYGTYSYIAGEAPPSWRHPVVIAPSSLDLVRKSPLIGTHYPSVESGPNGDMVAAVQPLLSYPHAVRLPFPQALQGQGHMQHGATVSASVPVSQSAPSLRGFVRAAGPPMNFSQLNPSAPQISSQGVAVQGLQKRTYSATRSPCPPQHPIAPISIFPSTPSPATTASEHATGGPQRLHHTPRRCFVYHPYAWRRPDDGAQRQQLSATPTLPPQTSSVAPPPPPPPPAVTATNSSPKVDAAKAESPKLTPASPTALSTAPAAATTVARPVVRVPSCEGSWPHPFRWGPPLLHGWPAGHASGYVLNPAQINFPRLQQYLSLYQKAYHGDVAEPYQVIGDYKKEGDSTLRELDEAGNRKQ